MDARLQAASVTLANVHRARVLETKPEGDRTVCVLAEGSRIVVSNFLAAQIRPGDKIEFPLAVDSAGIGTEVYIHKGSPSARVSDVYQTSLGYAAQPKTDKRERLNVRAEVVSGRLGISALHLPCEVLRDYFYVGNRRKPWDQQPTLYQVLRSTSTASLAELRLAFKLRELELRADGSSKGDLTALERAFNILAQPELRACYDVLRSIPSQVPALLFPYGGFGSILVAGERSRDGQTFFASRILSFLPEQRQRRFRAPLRKFDFHNDRALYRDARRKLEVLLDSAVIPLVWDASWNQWKHLLGAKVEIKATFVESANYRHRGGARHLVNWETALPSRVDVELPADIAEQVETARKTYHRFGQFSAALDRVRARIEREPVEREELQRLCWELHMPGDFDIAQINWQPDYDKFFYGELSRRARRLYLFREEYIFDMEQGVVVETPQLGHATYLFSKPQSMESFLRLYTRTTKEEIRSNCANVAERLGFLGRVVHSSNSSAWLQELRTKLGEATEYTQVVSN